MRLFTPALAAALMFLTLPAQALEARTYPGNQIRVDDVVGRLDIRTDPSATSITLSVTGPARELSWVSVKQTERGVLVTQDRPNFGRDNGDRDNWVTVTATVPANGNIEILDHIGDGTVGDLTGTLTVKDFMSGTMAIGDTASTSIGIAGSGDIVMGDVKKELAIAIDGSGNVKTGRTNGPLALSINGSGDIDVAAINGPVTASINGSGNVDLKAGHANALTVSINGSGDLNLDGTASAQVIRQSGSGKVQITGKQ